MSKKWIGRKKDTCGRKRNRFFFILVKNKIGPKRRGTILNENGYAHFCRVSNLKFLKQYVEHY